MAIQLLIFINYVVGYEIAFLSAPRSMQGTAIGMYMSVQGIGLIFCALVDYNLPQMTNSDAKSILWISGIAGNFVGLTLLILTHTKYNLTPLR